MHLPVSWDGDATFLFERTAALLKRTTARRHAQKGTGAEETKSDAVVASQENDRRRPAQEVDLRSVISGSSLLPAPDSCPEADRAEL
jgi:hypothetical protein